MSNFLITCEGCGAQIIFQDGQELAKCEYCGRINQSPQYTQQAGEIQRAEPIPPQQGKISKEKIEKIIKRAYLLMEEHDYQKAAEVLQFVIKEDKKNVAAYIGLLMTDLRVPTEEAIVQNAWRSLTDYEYYNKALEYATPTQREKLESYEQQAQINIKLLSEESDRNMRKSLKILGLIAVAFVSFIIIISFYSSALTKKNTYVSAVAYEEKDDYTKAISLLASIPDYKDTETKLEAIGEEAYSAGDLASAAYAWRLTGNYAKLQNYSSLIAAGDSFVIGVQGDGTAVSMGDNSFGQCNVAGWSDIAAVAAGSNFTVGLKKDGTVIATGNNAYGQCNVSDWTAIQQIAAGYDFTVGLKSDGTVVATGDNAYGQCDVSEWTGITQVTAGSIHTLALKQDGTAVAVGNNVHGQCDVSEWKDIHQVAAGNFFSAGLRSDGSSCLTMYSGSAAFYKTGLENKASYIAAGYNSCLFVGADGSPGISGSENFTSIDKSLLKWEDLLTVSVGSKCIIGLQADGTVVSTDDSLSPGWKLYFTND